jgi:hypothetical protein
LARLRSALLAMVGFAILAGAAVGAGFGVYYGVRGLWHVFLGLPREVGVATVAASATIFASVLAVVIGQYMQRQASIRQEIRKANAPVYERWLSLWFGLLFADKTGQEPLSEQEFVHQMTQFSQQLLMWGSDRALRQWVELRLALVDDDEDDEAKMEASKENMLLLAKFMRTLRRDMGHKNRRVDDLTLLGLFINDAREIFGGPG